MAINAPFNILFAFASIEVGCLGMTWKPEFSVHQANLSNVTGPDFLS